MLFGIAPETVPVQITANVTKDIEVVPIDVGWSDIGSFTAFADVYEPDRNGNIVRQSDFI